MRTKKAIAQKAETKSVTNAVKGSGVRRKSMKSMVDKRNSRLPSTAEPNTTNQTRSEEPSSDYQKRNQQISADNVGAHSTVIMGKSDGVKKKGMKSLVTTQAKHKPSNAAPEVKRQSKNGPFVSGYKKQVSKTGIQF